MSCSQTSVKQVLSLYIKHYTKHCAWTFLCRKKIKINVLKALFQPRHHLFFSSAVAQFGHWICHITFRWNCRFKNTCYAQPDLVYHPHRPTRHFRSHHSALNADCFPWSESSSYRSPLCDKSIMLAVDVITPSEPRYPVQPLIVPAEMKALLSEDNGTIIAL